MAGGGKAHLRLRRDVLLRAEDLVVEFGHGRSRRVQAVSGVSFDIRPGEVLGLVGESGCGKSTTARSVLCLPPPSSGSVVFNGVDLVKLPEAERRLYRPKIQTIFQEPQASLNPRRSVLQSVIEPLRIWGRHEDNAGRRERAIEELDRVGIDAGQVNRRPHELSGGQCQRVSIARATVLEPDILICDEAVSALDVSIQAQILSVLEKMREVHQLTLLFISHDLSVVKSISDRVAVMYLGKFCEIGPTEALYESPKHPYTAALYESVPVPDPRVVRSRRVSLRSSEIPSASSPPSGCRFRTRCPFATQVCRESEPQMREFRPGHFAACHHPLG